MTRRLMAVTVTLMLSAHGLTAQQHQHGQQNQPQQGMGQQGMGPARMLQGPSPTQLLEKRADLVLTDDQVKELERIQAEAKTAHEEAMASHDKHMQEMHQALQAEQPDAQLVRAHFQGAHDSMGAAHWSQMDASLKAMALLTADQRAKVKSWGGSCCQGMGQGMQHQHGMPEARRD